MSPIAVDQVRRALRATFDNDDAQSPDLTLELLDMMISAAIDRELNRRRDLLWKRTQRIGIIIGIVAGITGVITGITVFLNILFAAKVGL